MQLQVKTDLKVDSNQLKVELSRNGETTQLGMSDQQELIWIGSIAPRFNIGSPPIKVSVLLRNLPTNKNFDIIVVLSWKGLSGKCEVLFQPNF